ncbi:MAG: S1 RNA-binding domain-containing protein [Breznakia sp.]
MYQNGDIVEGTITGIKPYGVFVRLDDYHNGLLHISEISDDYICDIHEYINMKQPIRVKILDTGSDDQHFKLSLKALYKDGNRHKRLLRHHQLLPKNIIGFKTLEKYLDIWIAKAKEE